MNKLLLQHFSLCLLLFALSGPVLAESLDCPCRVVEVTAGDTVYLVDQARSNRKIWMSGIDAPQLEQPFGPHARENLSRLVLGKDVEVRSIQRDRYGRIVARLLKQGRDINLQQIMDGYAWHYKLQADGLSEQDQARYLAAENQARQQKLGLWGRPDALAPWKFRSQQSGPAIQ